MTGTMASVTVIVCLCLVVSFSLPAQPVNLAPNGDFEQVRKAGQGPEDWDAFGQPKPRVAMTGTDVASGQRAVILENAQKGFGGIQSRAIALRQKEPIALLIGAGAKLPSPLPGGKKAYSFGISLQVKYADGLQKWESIPEGCFNPQTSGWQKVSFVWAPTKPIESFNIRLMYSDAGSAAFDGVRVIELTEETLNSDIQLPGDVRPVRFTESFSDDTLPPFLVEHIGSWKVRDGVLVTGPGVRSAGRLNGQIPNAGWYLQSVYQYRLGEVSFRVRRDGDDGIVYFHTRTWRLSLRPNELTLKNVQVPFWAMSLVRPIVFKTGTWHTVRLVFGKDFVDIHWDGKQLAHWTGPHSEWPDTKYSHLFANWPWQSFARFGATDEILVFHPFGTAAAFDDLFVKGMQTGKADGFIKTLKYPGPFVKDNEFERLAPREPVDVNWKLPPGEVKAGLPPVKGWTIASPYGPDREPKGVFTFDFRVGVDPSSVFPPSVRHPRYSCPETIRIHFNLAGGGIYTLKLPLGGMKNLANILEIAVDGRPVSRDVYRGLNSSGVVGEGGILDYTPLKLGPGLHRVDLSLRTDLVDKAGGGRNAQWYWKFNNIAFGSPIELAPGIVRPEYAFSAKRPQSPVALAAPPEDTEVFGKELRFRITDLPDGDCTVRLGFQEVLLDASGERLMDIAINDKPVAQDFDVVKEAGGDMKYITRDFPATVSNGTLLGSLVGKNFEAFLNYLQVRRGDQVLFTYNAGWNPLFVNWGYYARYKENSNSRATYCDQARAPVPESRYIGQPGNERNYFEGHNLAANPRFTWAEADGRPFWWRSAVDLKKELDAQVFQCEMGDYKINELSSAGSYRQDTEVFHSALASMRIDKTEGVFGVTTVFPPVNYSKRQRFSAWLKSENAVGKASLALFWYAQDYFDKDLGGPALWLLGKSVSEQAVTGTTDWTEVVLSAKPPFGTAIAAMVVQVEDNMSGSFWVDDVSFDGYGSESLEITCSHLGFHPAGNKRVLIKARSKGDVRFTVMNASGREVASGPAEYAGQWRYPVRHYYRVDLSSITAPGAYTIKARQVVNSGDRQAGMAGFKASRPAGPIAEFTSIEAAATFEISPNIYKVLAEKLLKATWIKRFNVDVPGYHEPTHLDDYVNWPRVFPRFDHEVKVNPSVINTIGGFYDAGDVIKHWEYSISMTFGAMNVAAMGGISPDLAERGRVLVLWGLDSLANVQLADGSFYVSNKPYSYDSIPYFGIERFLSGRISLPQAAGVFAKAARELRESDPRRSAAFRQAAERVWAFAQGTWATQGLGNERLGFNRLLFAPKMVFADTYLSKLTGHRKYVEDLDLQLKTLCEALEARAYLEPGYRNYGEHAYMVLNAAINLDFLWSSTFFLEEYPGHPLAGRLGNALMVFVKDVERLSAIEPWGQAMDLEKEGVEPARWPCERPVSYWTMLAYGLARLGRIMDRPDVILLGERQIQWALGHNPFDVCMVHGVGDRYVGGGDMLFKETEFHRAFRKSGQKLWHFDGDVPTMAFRINREQCRYGKGNDSWGPISGAPVGYPPMYIQPDYPIDPGPTEFWQPQTGNFCSAAAAMSCAFEALSRSDRK